MQLELVLVILRRLVEDIHIFEAGLEQKRKKEMATALNEEVRDIFLCILTSLEVCPII